MRKLTSTERSLLVESIRQDGVRCPVLLDQHGKAIDGNNRLAIAKELGVECPTITLDVDDETADRLRVSLNVARRQLDANERRELVLTLRRANMSTREIAEQVGVSAMTVRRDLDGSTGTGVPVDPLPEKIIGRDGKVRSSTTKPRDYPAIYQRRKAKEEDQQRAEESKRVRKRINATSQYHRAKAAAAAPPGSLNLVALRRARSLRTQLVALAALVPAERFITQISVEACREFTPEIVDWWLALAALAAARLAIEGQDLPPLTTRESLS
jgi:DNA-binding Lrp family transcriptional regulator